MDLYANAAGLPWRLPVDLPPVSYRQLRDSGLSPAVIQWRARTSRRLQRMHRGVYLPGPQASGLLGRARAALLGVSPLAVLGFHTAAQLYGFGVAPSRRIHVLVPAGEPFPQRTGVMTHQSVLPFGRTETVFGLPCAPPARCAVDLARTLTRPDALSVLDAAVAAGTTTSDDLLVEVLRHDGLRGVRQARELVPLAEGRAECRQETHLRLLLIDAGITGFVPQLPVHDDTGRVRYRLDLGDPYHQVGVEYDGSSHLDRQRLAQDRERHNWLEEQGWAMRYFTATDLYLFPHRLLQTVTAARRSRGRRR